ncbi:MAG: ABC transporter substrate-binding protein [Burkholderiales bacterium]
MLVDKGLLGPFRVITGVLRSALVAGVVVASSSAGAQTVPGVTDTEILLGAVLDFSGPLAVIGGNERNGMTLAAEEINAAGGIHGRKIRILFEDSGLDPKKAVLATQKLVANNGVFAFVGTTGSGATQASMPVALDRNVPMLFPMATGDSTFKPFHPLKFGLLGLAHDHMAAGVKFAYDKLGKRRFGMIYQDDDTGQSALRAAEEQLKKLGLTLLERTSYKRGDSNFAAQVSRLKAANLDILLQGGVGSPRDIGGVAAETKLQDWSITTLIPAGAAASTIALNPQAVEGLYSMGMFVGLAQEKTPPYQAILDRYKARFGQDFSDPADFGYVAIMLFAEGAKNAGRNLTPQTLSQGLEKVKNFKTVFETPAISYGPNEHAPPSAAMVLQVQGGKWKVVAGPLGAN